MAFPFFVRFVFNAKFMSLQINKKFEFKIYKEHEKVIFKSIFILKIRFALINQIALDRNNNAAMQTVSYM